MLVLGYGLAVEDGPAAGGLAPWGLTVPLSQSLFLPAPLPPLTHPPQTLPRPRNCFLLLCRRVP